MNVIAFINSKGVVGKSTIACNTRRVIKVLYGYKRVIEEVIRKLDIPRAMVYIESLIMEVNINKDFNIGSEWSAAGKTSYGGKAAGIGGGFSGGETPFTNTGNLLNSAAWPGGFSLGTFTEVIKIAGIEFPSLAAVINAYKKDKDVQILSVEEPKKKKRTRGRPFPKGNNYASLRKKKTEKEKANILETYIKQKTSSGKKIADFYIGVIDSINKNEDAVECEKCAAFIYNGIRVNGDVVKQAHSWLTLNGWGRPSSRDKPQPEEPEMSREELMAGIKAME